MSEKLGNTYTAIAAADHTGKEGLFVVINGAVGGLPQVALAGAGVQSHGVIVRGDGATKSERIARGGQPEVVAGAAIVAGVEVEINASAKAITKSAGIAVGVALAAAGADGDKIPLFLYSK